MLLDWIRTVAIRVHNFSAKRLIKDDPIASRPMINTLCHTFRVVHQGTTAKINVDDIKNVYFFAQYTPLSTCIVNVNL